MKLWTVVSNGDDGITSQIATSAEDAARLAYGFVAEFWNDMRSDALPDDWQAAMEVLTSMPTFMDGVFVQEHEVAVPDFVGVELESLVDETDIWESETGVSEIMAPDHLRESLEANVAQMEADGIAREEERLKLHETLDGSQWAPDEIAEVATAIVDDYDAEVVSRAAPRWAWEIIDQTLEADSLSSAFDPNLRAMIRAATVAMLLACESANDEPISRQRVDDLIGEGTET